MTFKRGYNGHYNNPEYIEKQRNAKLGNKNPSWKGGNSTTYRKRLGELSTKEEYLKSNRNPIYKYQFKKGDKTVIARNKDPSFTKKRLKSLIKKPNKSEMILNDLLQQNFPKEWRHTGNGDVIIDNLNPDFINCNGKKLIIELFGDYWHSEARRHMTESERRKRFAKYGFKMLVIWNSELNDIPKVIGKVRNYMEAI